jgi:coenzyme F420-reducing hydrogenase gamma subunit
VNNEATMSTERNKPRVAVHKFSSCDGCQLAFINAGEALLQLASLVDIVHFAEAGYADEEAKVDIAFIEGSVSTPHELKRIQSIRENSKILITLGACATSGGLQALRNMHHTQQWIEGVYAQPDVIDLMADSTPISAQVKVDLELWGCPVSAGQVFAAVRSLLSGVTPLVEQETVCQECKRAQQVCVMVTKGEPCLGPVTRSGCGALCPAVGRDCYACFGPAEQANTAALAAHFRELGLAPEAIARRFLFINSHAGPFLSEGKKWQGGEGK